MRTVRREIFEAGKIYAGWDIFLFAESEQRNNRDANGVFFIPFEKQSIYRCIELADGNLKEGEIIYKNTTPTELAEMIGLKLAFNKTKMAQYE